jgi:GTP-binding protein
MNVLNAEFLISAAKVEQFPQFVYPETAFAGRSNVGKSSLLNSIVMRKNLARTSSTPGKTQQINFFLVEEKWSFADLPGFGYASIGKDHRENWAELNFEYLAERENLRFVNLLIDSRHDPQPKDLALIEWCENNQKKYLVILTKCDKLKDKQIAQRQEQIQQLLIQCNFAIDVLPYSSLKGTGRKQLLAIFKRELVKNNYKE